MKYRCGRFTLLILLLIMAPAPAWEQTSPTDALIAKARSLEGRGRADLAAQTWHQVLLADPNNAEALAGLARYAKQNGKAEESKTYLDRLRKVNPGHPAIAQVESTPVLTQHQARLREAERLAGNQQFDEAMQRYREVFGDNPPPGGYAIAYYETQAAVPGGWEGATAGLQKLTERYPESEDYRLSLGRLWTYRPATRLAGMRLLESIKGSAVLLNKARQAWRQALVWEGSNPQVLPSLRAYLAKYPDPELQKVLGQPSQPVRTGLARNSNENLGYIALKASSLKEAEADFEAALKEAPHSPGALAGMGFVRMSQQDFTGAIDYFQSADAESPREKLVLDGLEAARFFQAMKEAAAATDAHRPLEGASLYRKAMAMRPNSPEAINGLVGALMKVGDWSAAAPVVEKLVELQPRNAEAWYELVNTRYHVAGAESALASARQLPAEVQAALAKSVDYLALLAAASSDAGKNAESRAYLAQAVDLANTRGLELPIPLQVQFAGLYLRLGHAVEAATVFQRVTDATPGNVDAWEGLLGALVQVHEEGRALRTVEHMPKDAATEAMRRPAFLRSMASIQMSLGRPEAAEESLRRSIELDTSTETKENVSAQLQLAHIWLQRGEPRQAETLLRQMVASHPDNPDVWKALVAALHQAGRDQEAINEDTRVPPAMSVGLRSDADYVSVLAASQNALGRYDEALRQVRRSITLMTAQKRLVPADLEIQFAWLLLNTQGDERELYTLLQRVGARDDLSPIQEHGVSDIWSSWTMRRAQAAVAAGDRARAIAILEAAQRLLPKDVKIQGFLAGTLLDSGERQKALAVYKTWALTGANAADYSGAIGAAMSEGDNHLAATWLRTALMRWPNNAEILTLAGKQAAAAGDFARARSYWRAALVAMPADSEKARSGLESAALPIAKTGRSPAESIGDLLLGGEVPAEPRHREGVAPRDDVSTPAPIQQPRPLAIPAPPAQSAPLPVPPGAPATRPASTPVKKTSTELNTSKVELLLVSQQQADPPVLPRVGPVIPQQPGMERTSQDSTDQAQPKQTPVLPSVPISAPEAKVFLDPLALRPTSLRSQVQDELDAIAARNTPYFTMGGGLLARSGESGFERLVVQEADLEASQVVLEKVRLTFTARATYLDAGTPDGQSQKRFGLLPEGSTFDAQTGGGVGGEVQASTQTFGLMVGSTPRNFLVSNFIGGIRFRPGNGPITLMAERENLKDSMLAYAGARDPISNRVWGGVVANTASILGNWGGAASGFYANFNFQTITGKQVESNQRVQGNAGAYWRIFGSKDGGLTAGLNLTAMHYDKNLRYYTLGQGGYFSPQRYFLFSIPVRWQGTYKARLRYSASGTLGSQFFEEDTSAYFPTLPTLQGRNGPVYPKQSSTGANYGVDVRVGYQFTPEWYFGAWANFNNARNYDSQSAGVSLNYSIRPRPLSPELTVPSIPDWRGFQPFTIR